MQTVSKLVIMYNKVVEKDGNGFRGPQVCQIVGITYRQLDYWARTNLLKPSLTDAKGSGTARLYSYNDLLCLKVIKQLLDAGIQLRSARKAIQCLNAAHQSLASVNLVIGPDATILIQNGEELLNLIQTGQSVFNILPLGNLQNEVDTKIVQLLPEWSVDDSTRYPDTSVAKAI